METDQPLGRMSEPGFQLVQPKVSGLTEFRTSLEHLFRVAHMGICDLTGVPYQLEVGGLVKKPLKLTLDELARYPRERLLAVHECAGSPIRPTVPVRRAGNVEWEGVPLTCLMEEAGVLPEAQYMWSRGADFGEFNGVPSRFYQKDLPIHVAWHGKVLLATHINGEPLPVRRGAPLRLVVPDFYGTNSTKWLTRLDFQATRASGYYTTRLYNDDFHGTPAPVWALAPHALIVSHAEEKPVLAGEQEIWGWAWARGGVAQAEVSLDGGQHWQVATLAPREEYAWQRFAILADVPAGPQHWLCRAIATDGRVQPASGARNEYHGLHLNVIEPGHTPPRLP